MPARIAPSRLVAHVVARWGASVLSATRLTPGASAQVAPGVCARLEQRGSGLVLHVDGVAPLPLKQGVSGTMAIAGALLEVTCDDAAPLALPRGARSRRRGALVALMAASAAHAFVLVGGARASFGATAPVDASSEIRQMLAHAEAPSSARDPVVGFEDGADQGKVINLDEGDGRAGGGEKAAGESGAMGATSSRARVPKRFTTRGATPDARGGGPRQGGEALDAAAFANAMKLALGGPTKSVDAPAFGEDKLDADGRMWARESGEGAGVAGLGLSGKGEGGGGKGEGVGLDLTGGVGHTHGAPGSGTGGEGTALHGGIGIGGWGDRWGDIGIGRGHMIRTRGVGFGSGGEQGRLPKESIQRVVQANFGRFRLCYERALVGNPSLESRVTTQFVISSTGAVESAASSSKTPSPTFTTCVAKAFQTLQFPKPPGGASIHITYPIVFEKD